MPKAEIAEKHRDPPKKKAIIKLQAVSSNFARAGRHCFAIVEIIRSREQLNSEERGLRWQTTRRMEVYVVLITISCALSQRFQFVAPELLGAAQRNAN